MGKQINFYQVESDLEELLVFLKKNNLSIFTLNGTQIEHVSNLHTHSVVVDEMCGCKNYECNPHVEYAIPTDLCKLGLEVARFYYPNSSQYEIKDIKGMKIINNGRFYLDESFYDNPKIVSIYELLRSYIKKKYIYSKEMSSYFSPEFMSQYRNGYVFAANGNNVFSVTDV